MKYPKEVKAQALARMMAPRNEPVTKVSREPLPRLRAKGGA
jgi:hypothetical protein